MFERRRKMGVAGLAAVAATAMLAAGCGSSSHSTTTATKGGTVTLANIDGAGANMAFPFATGAYYSVTNYEDFMYLMDRPLIVFGGNNSSITANYALSPASAPVYSNGNKTVVINLKGWKWSNGESVDANDVIFWLNMDEAEKANWPGYAPGGIPDNLVSYKATGPDQVTLQLNSSYSSYWYTYNELAQINPMPDSWDVTSLGAAPDSGGCLTDSAADKWAKCAAVYTFLLAQAKDYSTYATSPLWTVSDGPFKLQSYNVNGNYTFVPNPKYSGPQKPNISALVFKAYTDDTAIYTALQTHSLSIAGIPPQDLPLKPNLSQVLPTTNPLGSAYNLQPAYSFGIQYAYENWNNPTYGPVFKQLYFREALQYLMDQTTIDQTINRGYGYATTSGVPNEPSSQWVSSDMTADHGNGVFAYNPTKAEALLAAHGWKVVGGVLTCESPGSGAADCGAGISKGLQAKFSMLYTSGIAAQQDIVEVYKSDLAKAGISLSPAAETFNTLLGDTIPCKGSSCSWTFLYLGGWDFNGPGFEPTGEPLFQTGAGSNSGGYTNPEMDKLINLTHTSSSINVFHTYANYTATDLPFLWMPNSYGVVAVSTSVHNVGQNPLAMIFPEYWYVTKSTP
jgi:peptide/nickel transport system substrate-binding protein